jgi:hypothetical protein
MRMGFHDLLYQFDARNISETGIRSYKSMCKNVDSVGTLVLKFKLPKEINTKRTLKN